MTETTETRARCSLCRATCDPAELRHVLGFALCSPTCVDQFGALWVKTEMDWRTAASVCHVCGKDAKQHFAAIPTCSDACTEEAIETITEWAVAGDEYAVKVLAVGHAVADEGLS